MRLFAALPLPDAIARPLLGVQHGVPGARWRPREALHITLAFYGETPPVLADDLAAQLAKINAPALQLELGEAGSFGRKAPRSLWIGIRPNAALDQLAAACRAAASRAGLVCESRTYKPHITLAYCRGTTAADAARFLTRMASFSLPAFTLDRFGLYQSQLGQDRARYHLMHDYKLNSV